MHQDRTNQLLTRARKLLSEQWIDRPELHNHFEKKIQKYIQEECERNLRYKWKCRPSRILFFLHNFGDVTNLLFSFLSMKSALQFCCINQYSTVWVDRVHRICTLKKQSTFSLRYGDIPQNPFIWDKLRNKDLTIELEDSLDFYYTNPIPSTKTVRLVLCPNGVRTTFQYLPFHTFPERLAIDLIDYTTFESIKKNLHFWLIRQLCGKVTHLYLHMHKLNVIQILKQHPWTSLQCLFVSSWNGVSCKIFFLEPRQFPNLQKIYCIPFDPNTNEKKRNQIWDKSDDDFIEDEAYVVNWNFLAPSSLLILPDIFSSWNEFSWNECLSNVLL